VSVRGAWRGTLARRGGGAAGCRGRPDAPGRRLPRRPPTPSGVGRV